MALIKTSNPDAKMQWLFSLCDSDHDGLVKQTDVIEVLTILMVLGTADPASAQPDENGVEQTMNLLETKSKELVDNMFAGEEQINVDKFRQGFGEREANFFDGVARYLSIGMIGGAL